MKHGGNQPAWTCGGRFHNASRWDAKPAEKYGPRDSELEIWKLTADATEVVSIEAKGFLADGLYYGTHEQLIAQCEDQKRDLLSWRMVQSVK